MAHTYTNLLVHMLFSTKDRVGFITPPMASRLHPYLGGLLRGLGGKPILVNGPLDHVHLLFYLPPTGLWPRLMALLKAHGIEFDERYLE